MSSERDFAADLRLCNEASPGPWFAIYDGTIWYVPGVVTGTTEANAKVAAAAREGWPAALREIERMQGRLAELEAVLRKYKEMECQ